LAGEQLELTDLLNTVLDKGVVLHGEVTLAVADVDLVKLNLGLLLSALETIDRQHNTKAKPQAGSLANAFGPINFDRTPMQGLPAGGDEASVIRRVSQDQPSAEVVSAVPPGREPRVQATTSLSEETNEAQAQASINELAKNLPHRINADPKAPETGLARLVLTLIEVLRKVLEHQAIRRMDGGKLSTAEIERLGLALSQLNDKMDDLKQVFGLTTEDLQIDLGPLGRLR
jgi:hypothetical protein